MVLSKKCRKCVLILLDGLGDRSYAELNHQTPLEAAHTPTLDALAAAGANGLYHAGRPGLPLPGENAHFAMFGYRPSEFPGRGAIEALGAGISMGADDVAVIARFGHLVEKSDGLFLESVPLSVSEAEAKELMSVAGGFEKDGIAIRFHRVQGLSGILTLKGVVSPYITDSDPILGGRHLSAVKPWAAFARHPSAIRTAAVIRTYLTHVFQKLKNHPINRARQKADKPPVTGMMTQRAGRLKTVPFFRERYGLSGICVASGIIYRGLSAYIGLDFHPMADTHDPGADLAARIDAARDLLGQYEFIHVHTQTPDKAGHAKDPVAKKAVIESLDRGLETAIAPLMADPEVLIVVTADHSTPSSGPLMHSGEPVPLAFHGDGIRRDRVAHFNEIEAGAGALGHLRGKELMLMILNHLDRIKLRGLMDTPSDQLYWPGDYEHFRLS